MCKKRNQEAKSKCGQCRQVEVINVRRSRFYKGVLIENIPATYCLNCGEELYDLATLQLMEKIAAKPEKYAEVVEMPLARLA